jgi:hypothetical protein
MTQLPATWVEAMETEALTYARGWIAQQREPGGCFHPDAGSVHSAIAMKTFALAHPFGADEIVYFAENGSQPAAEVLEEIIVERIDRNEPLGAVLGAYDIRRRSPHREAPGSAKTDNFVRDIGIALLVVELMDRFGLRPNLGRVSKGPSASTIAAEALSEPGVRMAMTFMGVEKIWGRYKPVFAGTRFAARTRRFAFGWHSGYIGLFG